MKFSSIFQANFPFSPLRFPLFYGWCIVIFTTLGMIASIPGQTMGVGVYTDFLIQNSHLNRIQISMAYMTGTILSSLLLPLAGRYYDLVGGRIMIVFAGIGMGTLSYCFTDYACSCCDWELINDYCHSSVDHETCFRNGDDDRSGFQGNCRCK